MSDTRYFSIDIFDTLLTRNYIDPHFVFDEVGRRSSAYGKWTPREFRQARITSEVRAHRRLGPQKQPGIVDIYSELGGLLQLSEEAESTLLAIELSVELEAAIPWDPGLLLLERHRKSHHFVGFISDMYLPSDFLKEMLRKVGAWNEDDTIYVSCEEGRTKSSGTLFESLRDRLGLKPEEWVHIGDNIVSDITMPASLGILTASVVPPCGKGLQSRILKSLSSNAPAHNEELIGGAIARATRLIPDDLTGQKREAWSIGVRTLGPLAYWFASKVLAEAASLGIDTLWFLSRDGEIPYKAAQRITAKSDETHPHLKYIYVSRQSLHAPSLYRVDDEAKRWMFANSERITIENVIERLSASDDLARQLRVNDTGEVIGTRLGEVWKRIVSDESLVGDIERHCAKLRSKCAAYLNANHGGGKLGIVDVGWGGNMQCSLQRLMPGVDIMGFYLGLTNRNPELDAAKSKGFLFEPENVDRSYWNPNIPVLEALFSGTHPGVNGYKWNEQHNSEPTFFPARSWHLQTNWGIDALQEGALCFVDQALAANLAITDNVAHSLLRRFLDRPDETESEVVGSWPCQNLQEDSSSTTLVQDARWSALTRQVIPNAPAVDFAWPGAWKKRNGLLKYVYHRLGRNLRHRIDCRLRRSPKL